ncbi:transcription antitermination protein NusB [Spiroplasma litorale]|uniref:Transcription antitermination protein NusB n=1 Tax=Spiroplasma litorale TaxID=216942 RepID=A0A0K1W1S9_9MOLU|nr:transcription antitermination factor NusB [Spiroplasma litorale]AKX34138.1 transcription antitermination protein NusB [Spiroplasma litorale]
MDKSITSLKKRRVLIIQILYRHFLMEQKNNIKQEIVDGFQLEKNDQDIEEYSFNLIDQLENLIKICEDNLSDNWKWKRIPNIIKAILVNGVYEINNKITPKSVIINESINLSRSFLPSWDTSFINAILDKIQ